MRNMRKLLFAAIVMAVASLLQMSYAQPKAVDLGLSVKWADRNLGALSPEEYGDYYAWGETSPKSDYLWKTLKYCTDTSGDCFNKYVPSNKSEYWSGNGSPDNKTCLDLSDDAARANLGGKWRIPTKDEWEELKDKCTWSWTGSGYRVTGPNGRSIFLPAAGVRDGSSSYFVGSNGVYWSSSLYTDYPYFAWRMNFYSGDYCMLNYLRFNGLSVRPVTE